MKFDGCLDILWENWDIQEDAVALFIKDDSVARLVTEFAAARRLTKQDAVRLAIQNQIERDAEAIKLRDRMSAWRAEHPLPPPTGQLADKAFFDDLSGDL